MAGREIRAGKMDEFVRQDSKRWRHKRRLAWTRAGRCNSHRVREKSSDRKGMPKHWLIGTLPIVAPISHLITGLHCMDRRKMSDRRYPCRLRCLLTISPAEVRTGPLLGERRLFPILRHGRCETVWRDPEQRVYAHLSSQPESTARQMEKR